MKIKLIAPSLLALCVASTGALKARAHEANPVPSTALYQDHDQDRWDQPPNEYRDAERRGFHEGVEAAQSDYSAHRRADADDHEVYKHPPVDESARKDFRDGFREGYRRAMDHMKNDRDQGEPRF